MPTKETPAQQNPATTANSEGEARLSKYSHQLLAAVICEPQLAKHLLNTPSIVKECTVAKDVSERLSAFLLEVSNLDGLERLRREDPHLKEKAQYAAPVLDKYGFNSSSIIEEALRQLTIGVTTAKAIAKDAEKDSSRHHLKVEVATIRGQEGSATGENDKLKLAQEKLLKRRNLEKLGDC
jgi:hypothetical protein